MIAKITPATMRPTLAPEVILTWVSFKRSGRVSTASGRDQDKRGLEGGKRSMDNLLWTSQKNAAAAIPLPRRDRRDEMKTAALTGMQQQKCLRVPMLLS